MNVIEHINKNVNEIELADVSDFDLHKIFECGQCFRWNVDESVSVNNKYDYYIGIAFNRVIKVRKVNTSIFISGSIDDYKSVWHDYFDLDRNYKEIRRQLCTDDFMHRATKFGEGIRLLRQDKWEALCSFIVSQNNNIPRIKTIIDILCREFGNMIEFENKQYFSFPSASVLANISVECLAPLRCGYRADYIISAAKMIDTGAVDLDVLTLSTADIARAELKKIRGVGDKVADCVILFGLHMLDAFPVDVWMKRAVEKHYGPDFDPGIFNPYAGIAQQYIFHYIRTGEKDSKTD